MLLRTLAICSLFHLGCLAIDTPVPLVVPDAGDLGCPAMPPMDMKPEPAKCAAAKGLSGDVLLCVDFDKVTGLEELEGWDFKNLDGCTGWMINSGKLQVNDIAKLGDGKSCQFLTSAIAGSSLDEKESKSVTLAVLHTVDLSELDYKSQIMLGADEPTTRLLAQQTGFQKRQISAFNILRTDWPQGESSYQYLFKISKITAKLAGRNWYIESIAIVGNK